MATIKEVGDQVKYLQGQIEKLKDTVDTLSQGPTPAQYAVYKGKNGAVQFNLLPACFVCKKCKEKNYTTYMHVKNKECDGRMEMRPGAILVEITKGVSQHKYDWSQKITFALSVQDLSAILNAFARGDKVRRFHDPYKGQPGREGKLSRTLEFDVGTNGGYIIKAQQVTKGFGSDDGTVRHAVGLSADEVRILRILFNSIIPKLLAWA